MLIYLIHFHIRGANVITPAEEDLPQSPRFLVNVGTMMNRT